MLQTQSESPTTPRFAVPAVILAVLVVFGRLFAADFTFWDDQMTLTENPLFTARAGVVEALRYYWTTPTQGLYVPVTWSLWTVVSKLALVDYYDQFGWRLNPVFFHGLSILTHLGASVLVLKILQRLLGNGWPALLGTLLFALHPVQAETVGWISGYKDLLCWLLSLATLLIYVRAAGHAAERHRSGWSGDWRLYVAALLLALAILSKPTAMVLPAAAWTIDAFLIRRGRWLRVLIDVAPLLAISATGAAVARVAQYVHHVKAVPLWQRPFVVGDTCSFYLGKLVWPHPLTFDYGRSPFVAIASPTFYLHWLLPAAVVAVAVILWRRRGAAELPVACGLFLIGIAPVSGLATFQMQNYSTVTDHYLYFSMLGPAIALGWILRTWPTTRCRVVAGIAIAMLGTKAFMQCGVWNNTFVLFEYCMAVRPNDAVVAPSNLATAYSALSPPLLDKAERNAELAYSRAPDNYFVINSYSATKFAVGKKDEALVAINRLRELLRTEPYGKEQRGELCATISMSLLNAGDLERAQDWVNEANEIAPYLPRVQTAFAAVRRAAAESARNTPASSRPTTSPAHPPASSPAR